MKAILKYDGKKLCSISLETIEDYFKSKEDWADQYAAESGLDREVDYNPDLLEVVVE